MNFESLEIEDLLIIENQSFSDDRGFFYESFNQREFEKVIGNEIKFVQDNFSVSKRGVLRGIHFQKKPFEQGKLVRVSKGRAYDVAIDLRKDSNTFLKWYGLELSDVNKKMFWIPEGFGHAFLALSDECHFCYKTTNYYDKSSEDCIIYNDNDLKINWPNLDREYILSPKDLEGKTIKELYFE